MPTHKTYAVHSIISCFLHFKKIFKGSHFSNNKHCRLVYGYSHTFVVELQSNSLQRWLRVCIRSVSVAFLYFIFPTFYGENFQTYRKIEMVIVDICALSRLSSKFLQFTIFALFAQCVHSRPFFFN